MLGLFGGFDSPHGPACVFAVCAFSNAPIADRDFDHEQHFQQFIFDRPGSPPTGV